MEDHRKLCIAITLAVAILAACPGPHSGAQAATKRPAAKLTVIRNEVHPIESFLKRATQELMDAVALGDTAVWGRYLAADCLYTDEEGETHTKAEMLSQLKPLPSGYEGKIRLSHPRVVMTGETAVITTEIPEELTLFGQRLETRFHTTSTWVLKLDGWQMIASQTSVLPSELDALKVDPAEFDAYAGTYALAPEVTYTVARDGKKLYGQRNGREREELHPLGCGRFFRKGANRGEKFFVRDATGRVTQMIDRRDNNDLVWTRTD